MAETIRDCRWFDEVAEYPSSHRDAVESVLFLLVRGIRTTGGVTLLPSQRKPGEETCTRRKGAHGGGPSYRLEAETRQRDKKGKGRGAYRSNQVEPLIILCCNYCGVSEEAARSRQSEIFLFH